MNILLEFIYHDRTSDQSSDFRWIRTIYRQRSRHDKSLQSVSEVDENKDKSSLSLSPGEAAIPIVMAYIYVCVIHGADNGCVRKTQRLHNCCEQELSMIGVYF